MDVKGRYCLLVLVAGGDVRVNLRGLGWVCGQCLGAGVEMLGFGGWQSQHTPTAGRYATKHAPQHLSQAQKGTVVGVETSPLYYSDLSTA